MLSRATHPCYVILVPLILAANALYSQGVTVSKTALDGGSTEVISFSFITKDRVSGVEFVRPGFVDELTLESVKSFKGDKETQIWVTTDSARFQKRIPHTAWLKREGKGLRLEFSTDVEKGDKIELSILLCVAEKSESQNASFGIRTWNRDLPNNKADYSTNALSIKDRNSKN